jgi:hypothetical protein
MSRYRKDDIQFRDRHACINIKVPWERLDRTVAKLHREKEIPETLTEDWIRANVSEDTLDELFWMTCESEYEYFVDYAKEIMPGIEFNQEGRSGGWAVSNYADYDVDGWDAIDVAKWRKIERIAREIAAGVPAQVVIAVHLNYYDAENVFVDAMPVEEVIATA